MFFTLKLNQYIKQAIQKIYNLPFISQPLPEFPFGKRLLATKEKYLSLYKFALYQDDQKVKEFEEICGYFVNKEWFNNLALHTQVVIKKEDLNFFHGRLLYSLLSKYINYKKSNNDNKPLIIMETGTARGFSSICMAKALIDQNSAGIVTTIDCIPHENKIFWNSIDDISGPKTRAKLLQKWDKELERIIFIQGWTNEVLNRLSIRRINFAFLDAQHTKNDVLKEFKYVADRQETGDIVVFDDVTEQSFPGVCEAIDFIEINFPYKIERISFTNKRGYAIAQKK